LLNILGGLDVPTAGSLHYRGEDLTEANEDELTRFRRDAVGFIFQFYNLIPSLTAKENVALITEISRDPMTPEDALALVELSDRMDHFPSQLSGGQQQRVAIARAIAKRPEVLLCDEPTGALDVKTGITVLEAIEHVNQTLGTLTVLITHNAVIADMADRVIHLSDGHVVDIRENKNRRPVRSLAW
jgi:putative ABC transport system ATP-binding protein